jgi:hypothetical protein
MRSTTLTPPLSLPSALLEAEGWETGADDEPAPEPAHFLATSTDADWQALLPYLPPDLAQSARQYGAFLRPRVIPSADVLLRLMLAYASGPSLDTVATRAIELELVPHLTDNALHERFERMVPWLSYLIGQQLAGQQATFPWGVPLHVRLLDASVLGRPGVTGTDWRLHLGLHLQTGLIDHLSVTGANIGEKLADFPLNPGDLVIGDRGYATRQGLAAVAAQDAESLMRLNWQNVPLQQPDGTPVALHALFPQASETAACAWDVQTLPTDDTPAVSGRCVIRALTEPAAARARRKVHAEAKKGGKTPSALTLEAAGYLILFTTVPAEVLTADQVVALYRMRWQIEIAFKRGKSALRLADIRAMTDAVCYAVILAKCLLLLLVERLAWATGLFSPSVSPASSHKSVSGVQRVRRDAADDPPAAADPVGLADFAARCAATQFYGTPPPQTSHPT